MPAAASTVSENCDQPQHGYRKKRCPQDRVRAVAGRRNGRLGGVGAGVSDGDGIGVGVGVGTGFSRMLVSSGSLSTVTVAWFWTSPGIWTLASTFTVSVTMPLSPAAFAPGSYVTVWLSLL